MTQPVRPFWATAAGTSRLVRFHADGWPWIRDSRQGFLNSLPPLLAFPLLSSLGLALGGGGPGAAAIDFLSTLVALLAPAVLSHLLATKWGRETPWLRFATAFNWCQLAVAAMGTVGFLVAVEMVDAGSVRAVAGLALLVTGLYALALQWFLARTGLALGGLRAAAFTLFVNGGTGILALGPSLLTR